MVTSGAISTLMRDRLAVILPIATHARPWSVVRMGLVPTAASGQVLSQCLPRLTC